MTATSSAEASRSYRFERLERGGIVLGLGPWGFGVAVGGLVLTMVAFQARASFWLVVATAGLTGGLAWGRWNQLSILEHIRVGTSWAVEVATGRRRWRARVHLLDPSRPATDATLALPACLAGLAIVDTVTATGQAMAAIEDRAAGTWTGLVRVSGRGFLLEPPEAQEDLLSGWGAALAGFAVEHGTVARLGWSSFVAPVGAGAHQVWLDGRGALPDEPAAVAYRELVGASTALAATPEVVMSVTVACPRRRSNGGGPGALGQALASLERALSDAGLDASAPLTAAEVATLLRCRVDPPAAIREESTAMLAAHLGWAPPSAATPVAMDVTWDHVRSDGAVHRTYWVMDWPRSPQPAAWLEPLLAPEGPGEREVTMVLVPASPSAARARVARAINRRNADTLARQESGHRVTASDDQAHSELLEREAELVAGHAEIGYVGLVRVAAGDLDELTEACAVTEQVAREHGATLRVLYGRQDAAWAAALPLGLGIGRVLE